MIVQRETAIDDIFEFINVHLYKLSAEQLPKFDKVDSDEVLIKLQRNWNYRFNFDPQNKILAFYVTAELSFQPMEIAKLSAEYEMNYEFKGDEFKEEFIHEHAEELAVPCADINTILVGFITDKMLGTPIIIPPIAKFE